MERLSDTHTVLYEKTLPKEAQSIRSTVFEKEQGFVDEIDGTDEIATHFVVFDGEKPVATCRVFLNSAEKEIGGNGVYLLGRFAVLREYRSRHIGAHLLQEAEKYVQKTGGHAVRLHAQLQAAGFYEKQGYMRIAEVDEEQGCSHIWLEKILP